jgi:hypothetical protein
MAWGRRVTNADEWVTNADEWVTNAVGRVTALRFLEMNTQ